MNAKDAVVIFTVEGPQTILAQGYSGAWKLNPSKAREFPYALLTQNLNKKVPYSTASEPHRSAFMLARIASVERSADPNCDGRWNFKLSEFARVSIADVWPGFRFPLWYENTLKDLEIDPDKLTWQPMPAPVVPPHQPPGAHDARSSFDMAYAKVGLAAHYGVRPEAIEIIIRG